MGPDNFSNQNNPTQVPPRQPAQRPIQDFGPRRAPQRTFNDFGPRPAAPGPQPRNNYAPQPSRQQPTNGIGPRPAYQQQPAQPQTPEQPQAQTPLSFEPPKKQKKKSKKLAAAISAAVIVVLAGSFAFIATSHDKKPAATAQNSKPTIKPMEKPEFTVYYPSPMPDGLTTAKGSISYYKESFTFIIEQGGQKSFFVYEQPASTDPGFSSLKGKLAAPKDISLTTGKGVEGGLDNGLITAVKTDKDTIIIINCIKTVCSTAPRDILSNMQLNTDLDSLRRSNS